ncbi:C40 family peptidase [Actinomadura barringtoniae]|uniref:C40 family peptidase n=1 Tax=Actinomadura barringtoniae TaxID=1427535 RepID=A0A939PH52_9ACTN|nr:C40 family peptidase [Actinomadura barringtoniae]MBO2452576.1 C40 family peptidase [Actinomadura barringtoniae]
MATACLTVTTSSIVLLPVGSAHADPKPTAASVQKKLDKLNDQVDHLVEKYNQVGEDLKVARRKLQAAQKATRTEQASFETLRQKVAQMAAQAYKNGDNGDVPGFLSADNPQTILDQSSIFSHLSENRSADLNQFVAAAQRVRREQAQAQSAFDEVNGKAKDLKGQKAKVDAMIKQQKKLLAKLGIKADSGGSGPRGGTYNGPASGNARKALDFAYSKLGTPYLYGGTGPRYDCSGLTMRAWEAAGVSITRTTNSQYAATKHIAKSDLQPGDLVFFSNLGHVGMYVGGGKMIHSPHTGASVEVTSITSGYYLSNFYGATRP